MPDEQFFSYMMARTSYFCFVLDQHAKLDFNSTSSLKQVCTSEWWVGFGQTEIFLSLALMY
jgi:hypothetical protein